jgi:hypothetical protein
MLLSAIAYNLKKLLKHQPKRTVNLALALQPASLRLVKRFFAPCLSENYVSFECSLNGGATDAEFCNSHARLINVINTAVTFDKAHLSNVTRLQSRPVYIRRLVTSA